MAIIWWVWHLRIWNEYINQQGNLTFFGCERSDYMIKITGKSGKSEIASAIQKYNGAEIYSYYNIMLPFENCYHINDDECSVIEFCDFIVDNIKENVNENDGLPLSMIVIYTNLSDVSDTGHLYAYAARLEEVEKLVRTVVVISQWMNDLLGRLEEVV